MTQDELNEMISWAKLRVDNTAQAAGIAEREYNLASRDLASIVGGRPTQPCLKRWRDEQERIKDGQIEIAETEDLDCCPNCGNDLEMRDGQPYCDKCCVFFRADED